MKEKQNAGFTLMEMLIAMMISMIIILGVGQFLVVGTKNYQAVDNQVKLQLEAQDAINAVTDMILESNNVLYMENSDGKYLCMYYTWGQKVIWLDSGNNERKLYLFVCRTGVEYTDAITVGGHHNKKLLAEHVRDMRLLYNGSAFLSGQDYIDVGAADGVKNAQIDIELTFGSKKFSNESNQDAYTYVALDGVAPRNEIVAIP